MNPIAWSVSSLATVVLAVYFNKCTSFIVAGNLSRICENISPPGNDSRRISKVFDRIPTSENIVCSQISKLLVNYQQLHSCLYDFSQI